MDKINLYIMDMTSSSNTSGVDRYIENLLYGLTNYSFIRIHRIQLIWDSSLLFARETTNEGYIKMTIPMPTDSKKIIGEEYWTNKYNVHLFSLIRHLFAQKRKCVIHIHTLNLIDLALYIKKQVDCKIITHLHCIPWKNYYNTNRKRFNKYYYSYVTSQSKESDGKHLITSRFEHASYLFPDRIICVTNNAREFIQEKLKIPTKISVIPNGIRDFADLPLKRDRANTSGLFKILFVGNFSESKGILFILEALRIITKRGYKVCLYIAGNCNTKAQNKISSEYSDLDLRLLGRISFEEMKAQYMENDMGIIASLQEQCSYVAIEMAMFGLPIVTTAVDGLDEMFEDKISALKVNTSFSRVYGLRVETEKLAEKIISLIENGSMKEGLGENARKRYEEKFKLDRMTQETVEIYNEMCYE